MGGVCIMSLSHNQMAYVAIISTLMFGSMFVGVSGVFQTSENIGNFDSAVEEDLLGTSDVTDPATDTDGDGLSDRLEETQYGTDINDADTDNDETKTSHIRWRRKWCWHRYFSPAKRV